MSSLYVFLTEVSLYPFVVYLTMFVWLLLVLLPTPALSESIRNTNTTSCIESERQALLSLKSGFTDHKRALSSWHSEDKDCCRWVGIQCSLKTGHITALDLSPSVMQKINNEERAFSVGGEISPSLLNLTFLSYLDLSVNNLHGFPSFIGSLNALRHLILYCSFDREVIVPPQLGNLSKLEYLDFGCGFPAVRIDSPEPISRLSSLRYLKMAGQNLSSPSNLFQSIMNLPSLVNIVFQNCIISIPSFPTNFSASKFLEGIHIIGGELNSPAAFLGWLNVSQKLVDLTVRYLTSGLQDTVLDFIGSMASLENLDLSSNDIVGEIPISWGNLCKLLTLDLSHNSINGTLNAFQNWTRCPHGYVLREFRAAGNQLRGSFDFTKFKSLEVLDVCGNKLNGSLSDDIWELINLSVLNISENAFYGILPENIGKLSNLTVLDVHSNFLEGVISESHISRLQRLKTLDLCFNSFEINLSSNFVPPFQLKILGLCSCKLGPRFPNWISTQENLVHLDISISGISDVVPSWLWDMCDRLKYFNISHNEVRGRAPNFSSGENIDLSSNLFEGPLPRFFSKALYLRLSENKFSGNIQFLCNQEFHLLQILDLSNNLLSGVLPDCWTSYALTILDLSNNDFQGTIPGSLGILPVLVSLRLGSNSLLGKLPSSFRSIKLISLGLGDNQISGSIPNWIGGLTELVILELQSNRLSGDIPTCLCQIKNIQILDLSLNNLSGAIPICLNNLTIMAQKTTKWRQTSISVGIAMGYMPWEYYIFNARVTWKGKKVEYQKLLGLLKLLDFSSNKLSGEIPAQLASLYGLISLNLSSNKLTGPIPAMIGQLQELDALDLSNNQLSGKIPESISNIPRLTNLDLSNNYLSGKIPSTTQMLTFNATSFAGNPGLCGIQIKNKCPNDGNLDTPNGSTDDSNQEDDQWFKSPWFYGSVALGFAIGFWGVCGPLVLYASFRHAYFQLLDRVKDNVLLAIALQMAKLKRRLLQS